MKKRSPKLESMRKTEQDKPFRKLVVRAAAVGGWVSGFCSRYAVEHIYLVGFIRLLVQVGLGLGL